MVGKSTFTMCLARLALSFFCDENTLEHSKNYTHCRVLSIEASTVYIHIYKLGPKCFYNTIYIYIYMVYDKCTYIYIYYRFDWI